MKFLLKLICCLLVCSGVMKPAWSGSFSVEDLRGFNGALPAPVAPYTKPDIDLMASKDPSYFKNTTPSVWDADADSLLQPYLDAINTVITPTAPGGAPVMILDVPLLPTDNQRNVSTFAQLLAAIHGYGGPLVTSDTIEALAEVTQLKSAVNTGINAVNDQYNQPPTTSSYSIRFGGGGYPFSTMGSLAAAYNGVTGTLNELPYLTYMQLYPYAPYTVAAGALLPPGVAGTKIPSAGTYAGMDLLVSALPIPAGGGGLHAVTNLSDFMGALRLPGGGTAGTVPSLATTSDTGIDNFIAAVQADLATFQGGGLTLTTITAVFNSAIKTTFPVTFTGLFTQYQGLAAIAGGQQYTYLHPGGG